MVRYGLHQWILSKLASSSDIISLGAPVHHVYPRMDTTLAARQEITFGS